MYIKSKGAKARDPSTTKGLQSHNCRKILSFYVFTQSKMSILAIISPFNNGFDSI